MENTHDQKHLNDVYALRLFKANRRLEGAPGRPICFSTNHLLPSQQLSLFDLDRFTPSTTSLKNALSRIETKMLRIPNIDAASLPNSPTASKSHSGKGFKLVVKAYQNHDEESKLSLDFQAVFYSK